MNFPYCTVQKYNKEITPDEGFKNSKTSGSCLERPYSGKMV
jgi:hypothetical protein